MKRIDWVGPITEIPVSMKVKRRNTSRIAKFCIPFNSPFRQKMISFDRHNEDFDILMFLQAIKARNPLQVSRLIGHGNLAENAIMTRKCAGTILFTG